MTSSQAHAFEQEINRILAAGDADQAEERAADYCRAAEVTVVEADLALSPRFRAPYFAGQTALAAGHLRNALKHLQPLLREAPRLSEELSARVRLLAAEAQARLQCYADARVPLEQVPAALLERKPLLHLRALRVRLWLGQVGDLGDDLVRCGRGLEADGETDNLALLACEEGRAWDRAGDLTRAKECWCRAERLTAAASRPDAIRADVLVQLGRLDHLRGHPASALDRFDAALGAAASTAQRLEVRLRQLLVRLDFNQPDQARAAAQHLLAGLQEEQIPEEVRPLATMIRCLVEGTTAPDASDEQQAFHAAARGDVSAARSLYLKAFAAVPSPERRARLALALALLAQGHAEHAEARSWLAQAEELARSLEMPETLARTLQVCGQLAAEQQGDDELARKYFEEAVLITEVQASQFGNLIIAHEYRQQRGSVLRHLLRSACRRGDADRVLHYQELERGRALLSLLQTAGRQVAGLPLFERPELADLESRLRNCNLDLETLRPDAALSERRQELLRQREAMELERDRLFEGFLDERGRRASPILPALPELTDLRRALPAGTMYVAPALVDDELFLLAVCRDAPPQVVRAPGRVSALTRCLDDLRGCLDTQIARYGRGLPLGCPAREELDGILQALGDGPLGLALAQALNGTPRRPGRVLWVPDGPLHGIPVHALRREGRYLIEDLEFVWGFSGSLCVHQVRTRGRGRWPFRPAVVVAEAPEVLPEAGREGEGVAASFFWGRRLAPGEANRKVLRHWLARARVVHFACHADFDGKRPLTACLHLPSGETIRALEWLEEPVGGLPLVTLSACRSAEVAPLLGREVFGLVTGLLGGGVRAVLAGLWPVADEEVRPLMWRFYRHRLLHPLPTALALTQREALAAPDSSPLFWGAFALFGDAAALRPAGFGGRWMARYRYRRHLHHFPA